MSISRTAPKRILIPLAGIIDAVVFLNRRHLHLKPTDIAELLFAPLSPGGRFIRMISVARFLLRKKRERKFAKKSRWFPVESELNAASPSAN
jgi:hypothetical protein